MFSSPKPFSAVTVQIDQLTSEEFEENDLGGIPDLIEVIRLQSTGPTEAARALRKKLKYGNVHRQLRALTLLDGLIQNAGPRFQRVFADEPLLERLRVAGVDPVSDPEVKAKCRQLFGQWAVSYKGTPGMEGVAALYRQLPQRKKPARQQPSKVLKETEAEAGFGTTTTITGGVHSPTSSISGPSRPLSLSATPSLLSPTKNKNKKEKTKPFNLEKEKPELQKAIGLASVASTNLMNALKFINRENNRVSEDKEASKRFEECKQLRRQILGYIQLIESEQWLGSLIHANDELVTALRAFELLDKSIEDDSDSEDAWEDSSAVKSSSAGKQDAADALAGLHLQSPSSPKSKPPRPLSIPIPPPPANGKERLQESESESEESEVEEEDENDPFADRNAVAGTTPSSEKPGMIWREV
ncbi:MAG: putative actin patch assembly and actin polymerization protein [Cirrosporium novae-zelandiae]|nr:MAG: putative actin patch assembly and actin polymerization protein [Cirrosporium novae-zelandiae]